MPWYILVVEDHAPTCELICSALESVGMETHSASNGAECLLAVETARPDLIILDIAMPVLDGFQTLDVLQQSEQNKSIPVVLLTARGSDLNAARGWPAGASAFITKPFSVGQMIAVIQKILEPDPEEGDDGSRA